MWVWLPMAGIVPALIGLAVGPAAVRVRGLYLAFATLALVFIGEWAWRNLTFVTGGSFAGRSFPDFQWRWWKEEQPLVDFTTDTVWLGFEASEEASVYLMMLGFLVLAPLVAKNLQRTRTGRAFQAIRDRDIAAEVMGVNEFRYKLMAFGISSVFAGVAGALFASFVGGDGRGSADPARRRGRAGVLPGPPCRRAQVLSGRQALQATQEVAVVVQEHPDVIRAYLGQSGEEHPG